DVWRRGPATHGALRRSRHCVAARQAGEVGKAAQMMPDGIPSSVRVIVRGFLNCNQVVLRAPGANVLIDSGYCTHGERTLELVAGTGGLAGEGLARLVNTHCHTDHVGGNG